MRDAIVTHVSPVHGNRGTMEVICIMPKIKKSIKPTPTVTDWPTFSTRMIAANPEMAEGVGRNARTADNSWKREWTFLPLYSFPFFLFQAKTSMKITSALSHCHNVIVLQENIVKKLQTWDINRHFYKEIFLLLSTDESVLSHFQGWYSLSLRVPHPPLNGPSDSLKLYFVLVLQILLCINWK